LNTASTQPQAYVTGILAAITGYRIADCDRLIVEAQTTLAPVTLIHEVYAPVLREAGDRWQSGQLSVVQEHMLSSAVRRQLGCALDSCNRSNPAWPCLAYTTLSGERHEMGSLMLAVIGASMGVRAIYLGPDLPVSEVGRFCANVQVAAVAISIITRPQVIDVDEQLQELRSLLPEAIDIWLGGYSALHLEPGQIPGKCTLIPDLADFQRRLAALAQQGKHQ
jgi:methanogenic corrinoid protein MtbC1